MNKGLAQVKLMLTKCWICAGCNKLADPSFAGDKNCQQFCDSREGKKK